MFEQPQAGVRFADVENELRIRKTCVIPADEIRFAEETPIILSDRDREQFLKALDQPSKPNPAVQRLMAGNGETRG